MPANIISQGNAAANLILNSKTFLNNALLREDEGKELDTALVTTVNANLSILSDMKTAGLKVGLSDMGTTFTQYEKVSDMGAAEMSMSGVTVGENDTPEFSLVTVPVPIIFQDFFINQRMLLASRNSGESLDTTSVEIATKNVTVAAESLVFNGSAKKINGHPIYGVFTEPNVNDGGTSAGAWSTVANIFTDIEDLLGLLFANGYKGPFNLYIANNLWVDLIKDSKATSDRTVFERIMAYAEIASIKYSDVIPDGKIALISMQRSVIDYAVAEEIKSATYDTGGGWTSNWKIYTCFTPRVKSDSNNVSGIAIMDNITP